MKKIVVGIIAILSLTFIQEPAHADICSTGLINVSGINTFGELPCSDPGTAINITVRGLHDYGVPGGPTGYCLFTYVRKNLGTEENTNWSASTNTVCDPKPSSPITIITDTPIPVTNDTPITVTTGTTIPVTTGTPIPDQLNGYAVVHPDGYVCGVIVGGSYFAGNDKTMESEYMGCPIGSRIILQTNASPDGNVAGWHGENIIYDQNQFTIKNNYDTSTIIIQNGIATDLSGRTWDTGSGICISQCTVTDTSTSTSDILTNTETPTSDIITNTETLTADISTVQLRSISTFESTTLESKVVAVFGNYVSNSRYKPSIKKVIRGKKYIRSWVI